ncbi:MAG: hypothetical protein HOP19_05160 [Acidobacteria bacterium]|nr:hypothetical protein [Acidobacteriota bacterium]
MTHLPSRLLCAALLSLALTGGLSAGFAQTAASQQSQMRRCLPVTPIAAERWRGEYFGNRDFSGDPLMVRDEGAADLNFAWGLSSPSAECGVPSDNFSVRWTRTIAVIAGLYRFTATGDDGFRLLLDGQTVIEEWREQFNQTKSVELNLSAGKHLIVLEYFERYGSATLKFNWENAPCLVKVAGDRWRGEYFANDKLSGAPTLVRDDGNAFLKFDKWGLRSPNESCLKATDNFSVRWTRTTTFPQGFYRFRFTADDGVRLFIDKQLKFEAWRDQNTAHTVDLELKAGNHTVVVEYFEHLGSALLEFNWELHPCLTNVAPDHWRGEYFESNDLTGNASVIRDEGQKDLELSFARNFTGRTNTQCLTREAFTARFTRKVTFAAGTYKFTLISAPRTRLLLDGEKLLDQWQSKGTQPAMIEVAVTAGNHQLVVEYGKDAGDGAVGLSWEPVVRALPVKRK